MHITRSLILGICLFLPVESAFALDASSLNTETATVFIAQYDTEKRFRGWGSGFFVDEGIIVTNKHVIDAGKTYRIFATSVKGGVDLECSKAITRSDVKVNLEDDVAYMRVYLPCEHGIVHFAERDPTLGSPVRVVGYPSRETFTASLQLSVTTGAVIGTTDGPWLRTNAYVHFGNSGGPVVQDGKVVGTAVAKVSDTEQNFVYGLFVPVSEIVRGLLYANDSTFGYTRQQFQNYGAYNPNGNTASILQRSSDTDEEYDPFFPRGKDPQYDATNGDCKQSLGSGGEATGNGGCRCKSSYHPNKAGTTCLPGAPGYEDPYNALRQKARKERLADRIVRHSSLQQEADLLEEDAEDSASLALEMSDLQESEEQAFSDVPSNFYAHKAIKNLRKKGVIGGYSDGTYRPENPVNRAEFLKILLEGFHAEEVQREVGCFADVGREWFAKYVCAAARLGWIQGYSDGTFRPGARINRAEAIKILVASLEDKLESAGVLPEDVDSTAWFARPVSMALKRGILGSDTPFRASKDLTRADAAQWIYDGTQ